MISYRRWKGKRKDRWGSLKDAWLRDGWFLFGFIPLFVRDIDHRENW